MSDYFGTGHLQHTLNGVPFQISYGYRITKGSDGVNRKYPIIIHIILDDKWDLTNIVDHSIQERLKTVIYKIINGES